MKRDYTGPSRIGRRAFVAGVLGGIQKSDETALFLSNTWIATFAAAVKRCP